MVTKKTAGNQRQPPCPESTGCSLLHARSNQYSFEQYDSRMVFPKMQIKFEPLMKNICCFFRNHSRPCIRKPDTKASRTASWKNNRKPAGFRYESDDQPQIMLSARPTMERCHSNSLSCSAILSPLTSTMTRITGSVFDLLSQRYAANPPSLSRNMTL